MLKGMLRAFSILGGKLEAQQKELDELRAANQRLFERLPVKTNKKVNDQDKVDAIRREWSAGRHTQLEIAEMFDLNPATVSRIVRHHYHSED